MGSRKAIVFSYHQPPKLTPLVAALEKHGYVIVLMVTGRGPNYAMSDGSYEAMGAQIADVFNTYDFPILAVKNVSQAKPSIMAVDADLALCLGFPYRLTEDILSTRTTFVNFHPAPLPSLAGGTPFGWPVLRPDLFKLENYRVTVHYMTPIIDEGRVIVKARIQLPEGIDAGNVTATQIHAASHEAFARSADEVVKLVTAGHEGESMEADPSEYVKDKNWRTSDEDRTMTTDMSVEQADRIWRARFGTQSPFFRTENGLYKVVAMRGLDPDSPAAKKAKRQPDGKHRMGTRLVQVFRDGVLELDLRKL